MSGSEPKSTHRAFFALWPDAATRAALAGAGRDVVAASGGRPVPHDNLHVTLAFLGELGADAFAAVRHIKPPAVGRFELAIDATVFRKRARLLWAAPSQVPPALYALEAGLWERLAEIGIARERRAYRPHVTLARRAARVGGTLKPVRWAVTEVALVESALARQGSTYTVVETWRL